LSIGTGITYLWILPKEIYDFWPHYLLLSFYLFVVLSVLAFLISVFDRKTADQNVLDYGLLPRPGRKVWISWIALILVMIGLYILFDGH
ncbi:MAG: hypothetical protein AB7D05_08785, partial [Mangrovibacterium sp.]